LNEFIDRVQSWAELIGPNIYLQAAVIAVAFVLTGKVAVFVISKIAAQIVSRSRTKLDDEVVALLRRPVFITFVLTGLAMATRRLGMSASPEFVTLGILRTIAIFVWYGFVSGLLNLVVAEIRQRRMAGMLQASMLPLFTTISRVILIVLAAYFVFLAWNINVTAWVASAGIVGLALSFAARDTLSNLFAGVSIAADAPYKAGDFIILESGERGMVTHIGLRSTRILTRDDVEITLPNGVIGNSKIINEAGGPSAKHRIRTAVGVAYGSDIDHVIETLAGIADEHEEVCKMPEPRVRFRRFGESSLEFELLCWIDRSIDRGRISHELNCALYRAFQRENIQIPFPQRDLHVRSMPAAEN
jgi:small-conductance mechanosensitive channel